MDYGLVGAFWLVSLLFVLTPGADWAYAITAGLRHRTVLPAVAGMIAGHVVATVAVAAGVAAVMAGVPLLLTVLTAVGAAYLIWLGIGTFRHPAAPQAAGQEADSGSTSRARQAVKGLGVSGLNPKVFLLFLALLPQFTDPAGTWPLATQILCLGMVHVLGCSVVYTVVGVGARVVLHARPAAARAVSRFSGAALVGIGAFLLIEQVAA
jgi:threonine/homoserine/homoserine lactone efflux protein